MHVDDRLATVLALAANGERARRTQLRQLLDLLAPAASGRAQIRAAGLARAASLLAALPADQGAAILEEQAHRIEDRALVATLAEAAPPVAAVALRAARLSETDWLDLIPELPVRARGFLRLRSDLPPPVVALLDRLGVADRGLPNPDTGAPARDPEPLPEAAPQVDRPGSRIGALVDRIEAFRRNRPNGEREPRPGRDGTRGGGAANDRTVTTLALRADRRSVLRWIDERRAWTLLGLELALLDPGLEEAVARGVPWRGSLDIPGLPPLAGRWTALLVPYFDEEEGEFDGFTGRLWRAAPAPEADVDESGLRQALHELRNPATVIQGYAELIQQQPASEVPNAYRAHAAIIAAEAARVLAGFDDLERLSQLRMGVADDTRGASDLRASVARLVTAVAPRLAPRESAIDLPPGGAPVRTAMAEPALDRMLWRIVAGIGALLPPKAAVEASLEEVGDAGGWVRLAFRLPEGFAADALFASTADAAGEATEFEIGAGPLGVGFAMRLARAEAEAAGGALAADGRRLVLTLPALTDPETESSRTGSGDRS